MAAIFKWPFAHMVVKAIQVPAAAAAQHLDLNSLRVPWRFG